MDKIGHHSLDIAGVTVKNHACTFEKIAQRVENTDMHSGALGMSQSHTQ